MKPFTIPLYQTPTSRGWHKDIGSTQNSAQVVNGMVQVGINNQMQTKTLWVSKRPGSVPDAFSITPIILSNEDGSGIGPLFVGSSDDIIYDEDETALGTLGGQVNFYRYCGATIGTKQVVAFCDNTGDGFYLYNDAISQNFPTFEGDTHSNTTIDGIADTTGIYKGQLVTGSGIPADTRVATVPTANSITITNAATSTANNVTITKEAVAKIIDPQFPDGSAINMQTINGYFFVATLKTIQNSQSNDPASWVAGDSLTLDWTGAEANAIFKVGNYIICGTDDSLQYFRFAGNSTGSVLARQNELNIKNINIQGQAMAYLNGAYYFISYGRNISALYRLRGINEVNQVSDDIWSGIMGLFSVKGVVSIGDKQYVFINQYASNSDNSGICYDPVDETTVVIQTPNQISNIDGEKFTERSSTNVWDWRTTNNADLYKDDSTAVSLIIITEPYYLNDGAPFSISNIRLVGDTQASGTLLVEASADDGSNFSTLGSIDLTSQDKALWSCGWYQSNVIFRLTHSSAAPFRGQALKVTYG